MALYGYIALDAQGIEQRGEVEARDEREARAQLRSRQLRVVHLQEGALPAADGWGVRALEFAAPLLPRNWLPVRGPDLALLFRQLALMLRAGHTLVHALDACARLTPKLRARALVRGLAERLRGGHNLSEAMRRAGRPFTPLMIALVGSGETSGELDTVFGRLADDLERRTELRRQLASALTYPAIVLLAAVGVVSFLVVTVIPRFATYLAGRGKEVPGPAQALLDISAWLADWGPLVAAAAVLALFGLLAARTFPPGRRLTDRFVLMIPVVGSTLVAAAMAQAAWTLALLVRSGATVLESLQVSAQVVGNRALGAAFERAGEAVLAGRSVSAALSQVVVPPLMRHMAEVGERSGELDTVMEAVGAYYRKELDARVKLLSAMIEPLLILFVGGIVGFVYFAFFQAVMTVSSR